VCLCCKKVQAEPFSEMGDEAGAKYDRQLRLWGAHGQKRLAKAHILLLGAGPTGTEALKNLVLPGIGRFTVVDGEEVGKADLANNFFVRKNEVGQPRAKVTCEYLRWLNPDVRGDHVKRDPVEFVRDAQTDLRVFSLVLVTELPMSQLLAVEEAFHALHVPIVIARTYGFLGYLRIVCASHCVIEAKPSPAPVEDLRIADPFKTLREFANKLDLGEMDSKEFKHVPYIIVLIKLLQDWKAAHDGTPPKTIAEKNEFRDAIKRKSRGHWSEEENLVEALDNAFLAFARKGIPDEVADVFDNKLCESGPVDDSMDSFNFRFWVMARGMKGFVNGEGEGKLPLSGVLPDMTATTELYVDMQNIYKEKARADAAIVHARSKKVLENLGADPNLVSEDDVANFCKNAMHLRFTKSSRLADEINPEKLNKEDIEMAIMEGIGDSGPQCPILFYFMLRACDDFHAKHGRFPGANGKLELPENDGDIAEVLKICQDIVSSLTMDTPVNITKEHAQEFTRYGGVELHNIAAVIGGIASQEAVKLITHQYELLSNTYVYNGITCTGASYNL